MLKAYRINSVEWNPSTVVALATSVDSSQVAAARADGSLEIWLVSPCSVGWHCQLTIHGDDNSRVSSLVWCQSGRRGGPLGRLLSSSIDGSISEWDLFDLRQKNMPFTDFFTEYGEANLYEIQEVVGKGSYGVVAAAVDTHT